MVVSFSQTRIFPFKVIWDFIVLRSIFFQTKTDKHTFLKLLAKNGCVVQFAMFRLFMVWAGKERERFFVFLDSFVKNI